MDGTSVAATWGLGATSSTEVIGISPWKPRHRKETAIGNLPNFLPFLMAFWRPLRPEYVRMSLFLCLYVAVLATRLCFTSSSEASARPKVLRGNFGSV